MKRREALSLAAGELAAVGIESARLESEMLLSYILGIRRHALYLDPEEEIGDTVYRQFYTLIEKRIKGVPIHYLVGEKEFMGLPFYVDERVLIPRFDTEVLCETVIHWLRAHPGQRRLADIGTGSGALAVSLVHYIPDLRVTAVDCSDAALAVARRNAETHGVTDRITFRRGDLLSPVSEVDAIVSNPPYIRAEEIPDMGEPRLALDGGPDGLDFYRRMVQESPDFLSKGGLIALEIGYGQAEAVTGLLASSGAFIDIDTRPDLSGIPRVITAIKK
jgi:release factor glutamine methyltransferase